MATARTRHSEPRPRVLVVDDAEGIRTYLANLLEIKGYSVDTAEDGRRALALLEGGANPDVVLLDVMMPGGDGLDTLRRMREVDPEVSVVMLSVVGKASTIVEAMRLGAADYLNKPFEEEDLLLTLDAVLETRALRDERDRLANELIPRGDAIVWASEPMAAVRELLAQVADTDVTVLIQGESGVGKEIVARTAHDLSPRRDKPFIKVNCAALPEELLESELFGYEKGAFTGAGGRKYGKFEIAHTGTIFLDEIGEMSPALQAKMLQVLQDSVFTRLGGHDEIRVDVQVVSATNRPLVEMVEQNQFREDLYFRVNIAKVPIPALRERRDDIIPLAERFLQEFSQRSHRSLSLSQAAAKALETYSFKGNIR